MIPSEILELFSGLERKTDFERWPDCVFFFKEEKWLFLYNLNSGALWCHKSEVWDKIAAAKGLNYTQNQQFIKNMVEQYFKLKSITPFLSASIQNYRWEIISN